MSAPILGTIKTTEGAAGIGRLERDRAALLVVDVQDKLLPAMPDAVQAQLVKNVRLLVEAARTLGLPIVVSQQYPKGLGQTVAPVAEAVAAAGAAGSAVHRFDKLEFAATACAEFAPLAKQLKRSQWIVCGMETHVCVYQTARGLCDRSYQVHVVADAVASRAKPSWRVGLDLCAGAGAVVTTAEATVFDLLGRAGTDEFKALSKLLK